MILREDKELEGPNRVTNYENLHEENVAEKVVSSSSNNVHDGVMNDVDEILRPLNKLPKPFTPLLPFP